MEQQRQNEPSFDRTEAEEALLIAARLQQEQRDRLSLSELKRTAAEVDIDPEFVEQAVSMLKAQPQHPRPATVQLPMSALVQAGTLLAVIVVQLLLARLSVPNPVLAVLPVWGLAALLAAGLGTLLPHGKDATSRGLAFIAVVPGLLICFFLVRRNVASYYENLEVGRMLLLFVVEAVAFLFGRRFRRASVEATTRQVEARQ